MKPLNQDQVDFLAHQARIGKSIPGQSLTNEPKNPYPWEKHEQFVDLHKASDYQFETMFNTDGMSKEINANYLDVDKTFDKRRKFNDKFLGICLKNNNSKNNLVTLYSTEAGIRKYFR